MRTIMPFVNSLDEEEVRRGTVLWLRGTGINAWHYYGFLQQFSLEQLGQFRRIICVSGGAAVFWIYVLSLGGHFDERIVDHYDEILRCVMNRGSILCRAGRILSFRSPYLASQQLALLAELVSKESFEWTLSQFPLRNFRVLVARGNTGYREFGEGDADGALQVASVIAIGGTPSTGQNLQISGIEADCFDFEYATAKYRKAYQRELIARFPEERKLILNTELQVLDAGGNCLYLCVSPDKYPGLMRGLDSARLLLNLPSGRYRKVFHWSRATRQDDLSSS
jgi:hypothetical protein